MYRKRVNRLWIKLVGTIALIMIVGSAGIVISVNVITKNRYRTMVHSGDIAAAETLSQFLPEYYSKKKKWENVELFLTDFLPAPMMRNQQEPLQTEGPGRRMTDRPGVSPAPGMMHQNRDRLGMMQIRHPLFGSRIVITDAERKVVFDSRNELHGAFHPSEHITEGAPIYYNENVVGYLFVGSMIESALNPADKTFLSTVNNAVMLTSIGVVIIAFVAGTLLVFHITSPLKRLTAVASQISSGNFSARIATGTNRKDEIGILTRQFNTMTESLDRAEKSLKQMISDSAHELRTPVSLIRGKLEMILEGVYPADKNHLQEIFEETTILSRLIEELQQLADADAGVLTLQKEETDIGNVIDHVLSLFKPEIMSRQAEIIVHNNANNATVLADRQKVSQVFTNLLSNTLRHIDQKGTIEIELIEVIEVTEEIEESDRQSFRTPDTFFDRSTTGHLRISLFNSGPHIPDDKLDKIFDRFFRLDSARNREHGGKGLGLAISKAIVEAHGGSIRAENVATGGVRFLIRL